MLDVAITGRTPPLFLFPCNTRESGYHRVGMVLWAVPILTLDKSAA